MLLYLLELFPNSLNEKSYIPLRSSYNIEVSTKCKTEKIKKSFFPSTVLL